jgi:hemoglobin
MTCKAMNWLVLIGVLLSALGCSANRRETLYDRLGGESGITIVINDFIDRFRTMEDERINNPLVKKRHDAAYIPALKEQWLRFVAQSTGGPDKYEGRSMKWAHAGLAITGEQFDRTIEIMAESLAASRVGEKEQKELLDLMRSHRKEIIEKHQGSKSY